MFSEMKLDSYYFTMPGFYLMFIPVGVPYKKIYGEAEKAGLKRIEQFGPILEKGKLFGRGWIGIEVQKPANGRPDVVHVEGTYQVFEHKGPYKDIGKACKAIRTEKPNVETCYNLYMDDPEKVAPKNLRTKILFR